MKYIAIAETIKGENRAKNTDHLLIKEDVGLHLICNGMGDANKATMATHMVTDFVAQSIIANKKTLADFKTNPSVEAKKAILNIIERTIKKISMQIFNLSNQEVPRTQMGTTLSLALVLDHKVFFANVGNNQAYIIREDKIHSLTDNKLKSKMVEDDAEDNIKDGDFYTGKEHYKSPDMTNKVGSEQDMKIELLFCEVMEGDILLLHTSGVTPHLKEAKILELVSETREYDLAKRISTFLKLQHNKNNATTLSISFEQSKSQVLHKKEAVVSPKDKYIALKQISCFSHLDYIEITKIMTLMHTEYFEKNNAIIKEGDAGDKFYVIVSGEANVFVNQKRVNQLKKGDYFGEISLIDNNPRSATIIALEKVETLVLSKSNFLSLLNQDPKVFVKMLWLFIQTLSARMRLSNQHTSEIHQDKTHIDNATLSPIRIDFD